VVQIDPQRHDWLMAHVQVLRHFLLICLGRTLMRQGFDLDVDLPVSGPWFNILTEMLSHQLEQPASLYTKMAVHNPMGRSVLAGFSENLEEVLKALRSGDEGSLTAIVEEVGSYMRSIPRKHLPN
jgi:prephenate dehydrogenase